MSDTQGVDDYYREPGGQGGTDNLRLDVPAAPVDSPSRSTMMDKLGQPTTVRCDEAVAAVAAHRARRLPEVFIHSPAGNGIGRLIVDPYSLLLSAAEPRTPQRINAKRAAATFRVSPSTRSCCERGLA